jgi:hypothetical protein
MAHGGLEGLQHNGFGAPSIFARATIGAEPRSGAE